MALQFNPEDRPNVFPLTKDEFSYIKLHKIQLFKRVEQLLSIDANTTALYDYLSTILPGFYEKFYFRYCYLKITDLRVDKYDKEKLEDSLDYCKKFCEVVKSPEVYNKYMKYYPGIVYNFVTDKDGYAFFDANLDELVLKFIEFVDKFSTFEDLKKHYSDFRRDISCGGGNYKEIYLDITTNTRRLFPPRKIPRY